MPQVFDAKTGTAVDASPEDAQAGLLSGQYGLDASHGPVTLAGKDGKHYSVAPDKVSNALATGAYSLLSHEDELKRSVAKEEKSKGVLGSVASGLESGVNQALLGVPDTFLDEVQSPEEIERRKAADDFHSTARLIGGAGGIGASMLFGGELFKGTELAGQAAEHLISPAEAIAKASLGTKIAAKAANMATQGAILASPQAITQAAFGDPQKAAETLLWGIGAGAVLGGAPELFSGALEAGGKALSEKVLGNESVQNALENFANKQPLRSLGATQGQLGKLSMDRIADLGETASQYIKPGMTRQELGDAIESARRSSGDDLGEAIKGLDATVPLSKTEAAPVRDRQAEFDAALRGEEPPKVAPRTGKPLLVSDEQQAITDKFLKPGDLADAIKSNLDSPELRMPMNADQARALDEVVKSAHMVPTSQVGNTDVISFGDAQNFVSSLRKKWVNSISKSANEGGVRGLETVSPLDQMKAAAYQFAKDSLHRASNDVAVASKNPELFGALAEAKMKYSKLSDLEKFAATLDRRDAAQGFATLSDHISMGQGPFTAATSALGASLGALAGPGGAMVGAMAGRVPGMALNYIAKKWVENRGMLYASALAKRAAKEGPEVFSAVIASEGAKRLAATMSEVRETVSQLAIRGTVNAARNSEHMQHLLGDTTGLSRDQQYSQLSKRLTSLASNPGAMASAVSALSAPFQSSAPDVADAYQQKMAATLQYLYQAVPKPSQPPMPFQPNNWTANPKDKLAFHDRAEIVANPMRAMAHVQQGTLSGAHLEALQTVYPQIYGMMRDEIMKWSGQHPDVKLPAAERASVAKFLGTPLDAVSQPEKTRAIQSTYQQGNKTGSGGGPKPRGKIKNMPSQSTAFSGTTGESELHS